MTRSTNHPDADYTISDMGVSDKRYSTEELENIEELKKDWENGIINEIIWADTEEKLKTNI